MTKPIGRPPALTPEQVAEACSRYRAGEPSTRIARCFGVQTATITRCLRANAIPVRPHGFRYPGRFDGAGASNAIKIQQRYLSGETTRAIAESLGLTVPGVCYALKACGIDRRTNSASHVKYTVNHEFFGCIASQEQAYWLGFLAADGWVKRNRMVGVTLSARDQQHVEKFKAAIQASNPIREHLGGVKNTEMATLEITSLKLVADLQALGIGSRKTWSLKWPHLPDPLVRHFLRGYFDGDGCFSAKAPLWSIESTWEFNQACQVYLIRECGLNTVKILPHRKSEGVCCLSYGGFHQVLRICRLIYQGATVCLDRKRDKAIAYYRSRGTDIGDWS